MSEQDEAREYPQANTSGLRDCWWKRLVVGRGATKRIQASVREQAEGHSLFIPLTGVNNIVWGVLFLFFVFLVVLLVVVK